MASSWIAISALSVLLFVGSLVVLWQVVVRMPADYFSETRKPGERRVSLWIKVSKNLAGMVLVVLGLVMLVTPGQGLLTLLMGMALIDFPGKQRVQRWLLSRPGVLPTLNRWRHRAGRDALVVDDR